MTKPMREAQQWGRRLVNTAVRTGEERWKLRNDSNTGSEDTKVRIYQQEKNFPEERGHSLEVKR